MACGNIRIHIHIPPRLAIEPVPTFLFLFFPIIPFCLVLILKKNVHYSRYTYTILDISLFYFLATILNVLKYIFGPHTHFAVFIAQCSN